VSAGGAATVPAALVQGMTMATIIGVAPDERSFFGE